MMFVFTLPHTNGSLDRIGEDIKVEKLYSLYTHKSVLRSKLVKIEKKFRSILKDKWEGASELWLGSGRWGSEVGIKSLFPS